MLNLNNTVVSDSNYTLAANEITLNTTGLYKIAVNVTANNTAARSNISFTVQVDTGVGYTDIAYSTAGSESREITPRFTASTTFLRSFSAGNKIRVRVVNPSGVATTTVANNSNLTIEFVR